MSASERYFPECVSSPTSSGEFLFADLQRLKGGYSAGYVL